MKTLNDIFNEQGTDKGTANPGWGRAHGYGPMYERLLSPLKHRPARLLEIGVWDGASIRSWLEFLPHAYVLALDNGSRCSIESVRFDRSRAAILRVEQGDRSQLQRAIEIWGGSFDAVIDDGSHFSSHQQISLGFLFPLVVPGGIYVVEDLTLPGVTFPDGSDNSDTRIAIQHRRWTDLVHATEAERIYLEQQAAATEVVPDMSAEYACGLIRKKPAPEILIDPDKRVA